MDKQKQIEEMAKATGGCDYPHRDCEKCWCREKDECGAYAYAKTLTEKDYRKIPEGAVVLETSVYESLDIKLYRDTITEKVRKETAEKFAERLKSEVLNFCGTVEENGYFERGKMFFCDDIDEICKEFTGGK